MSWGLLQLFEFVSTWNCPANFILVVFWGWIDNRETEHFFIGFKDSLDGQLDVPVRASEVRTKLLPLSLATTTENFDRDIETHFFRNNSTPPQRPPTRRSSVFHHSPPCGAVKASFDLSLSVETWLLQVRSTCCFE